MIILYWRSQEILWNLQDWELSTGEISRDKPGHVWQVFSTTANSYLCPLPPLLYILSHFFPHPLYNYEQAHWGSCLHLYTLHSHTSLLCSIHLMSCITRFKMQLYMHTDIIPSCGANWLRFWSLCILSVTAHVALMFIQRHHKICFSLRERFIIANRYRSLNCTQPILVLTAMLSEKPLQPLTWSPK